jgi:pyruvate dehydrogenase E1 component beta subunit
MRRDDRVFVFGEDVAAHGGVFKVTEGLLAQFGAARVFDTPLSESAIVGAAVGAAMMGMRPVAEIMFADFTTIAMDALVNSAAKVHYLSGGEVTAPLVVRMAYGAGPSWGAQHTQSVESWLMNVPGLQIVMPSTPRDAFGLLKSAIRTSNPVVFLEHKQLYAKKGEVPEDDFTIVLGSADIKRHGDAVTIVASGLMVDRALEAAEILAAEGTSAEVVDIRSVQPLDEATILTSVAKTGRLVVVHEAPVFGGMGGEIAALVAEKAFGYLDAPIRRIGAPWAPVPFGPVLVAAFVPSVSDVVRTVRETVGWPATAGGK